MGTKLRNRTIFAAFFAILFVLLYVAYRLLKP